jgi:hypothetical protein
VSGMLGIVRQLMLLTAGLAVRALWAFVCWWYYICPRCERNLTESYIGMSEPRLKCITEGCPEAERVRREDAQDMAEWVEWLKENRRKEENHGR